MFNLRQILDELQTHYLLIDLIAAYGSVKSNELLQITVEHGFPTKLFRVIRETLDASKSGVQTVAEITLFSFVTFDELKHGYALSNLLLNIFLIGTNGSFRWSCS